MASIAGQLLQSFGSEVPSPALRRAALQMLDALACAAGAADAPPTQVVRRVVRGSAPAQASLLYRQERAAMLDAVLVNGTAVRYLDYNDAFIGAGPGGHPSDNIPVALAVGECESASGRDVLAAIALGYELFWRFRQNIYGRTTEGTGWDGVSVSGVVAAAMSGLLMRLDHERLAHALALGAAKGYGLRELRRGEISMVKGCANALVARDGVLAAAMAREGMTGPLGILEGRSGLLRTFGLPVVEEIREQLCAPPEWVIERISVKVYPAIATSQAAIHAAILLTRQHELSDDDIDAVRVHLPDSKATREHMSIEERQRPTSRESADHSMPFLVACALQDGRLSVEQFERERWLQPHTLRMMAKVRVVPSASLEAAAATCHPAVVEVDTVDGRHLRQEVLVTPGSPDDPWGAEEILQKFRDVDQVGMSTGAVRSLGDAVLDLPDAADLTELLPRLRGQR